MKSEIKQDRQIKVFWSWFAQNHRAIEAAYDESDVEWLDSNLTSRIQAIEAELCWEVGPYNDPEYTLVISPSIRENILLAERIIDAAPTIPRWHFIAAKPPKELKSLAVQLPDQGAEACADEWLYRLTSYKNGEFFDIEIFADVPDSVEQEHLEVLTHKLIESILGERIYLDRIGSITIYGPNDPRTREKASKLTVLRDHVSQLLGAKNR